MPDALVDALNRQTAAIIKQAFTEALVQIVFREMARKPAESGHGTTRKGEGNVTQSKGVSGRERR